MQSLLVFTNSYGWDRILGSVWMGAYIFKKHPEWIKQHLNAKTISECFEFVFVQATAQELSKQEQPSHTFLAQKLNYAVSRLVLYQAKGFRVCHCSDLPTGRLGHPATKVNSRFLESKLTLQATKIAWSLEAQRLQVLYPEINLLTLAGINHKQLGLKILAEGPTFAVRKSYLQQVPLVWLDLLRLGHPAAKLEYYFKPPWWWQQEFAVSWWHFFSRKETLELSKLIGLQDLDLHVDYGAINWEHHRKQTVPQVINQDLII
jgi:hypothetical protein